MVSNKSATIQIIVFLYIIHLFSLDALSMCSFSLAFNGVMCLGIGFFVSILLGVSLTFVSAYFYLSSNFKNFRDYFSLSHFPLSHFSVCVVFSFILLVLQLD